MIPSISVVMSVLNGEEYLREAIESILSQTMPDFEFIIVNDGSTDRTKEILEDFQSRDGRILTIHQQNAGIVRAVKRACSLATGTWIARMDADDISLPHRFEKQLQFLKKNPSVVLLGGDIEMINSEGVGFDCQRYPALNHELQQLLLQSNYFAQSAVIFSREAFQRVGSYRTLFPYCEDYDLWLRLAEIGEIANLQEIIVRYRVHSNNVSWRKCPQQVTSFYAARMAAEFRHREGIELYPTKDNFSLEWLMQNGMTLMEIETAIALEYNSWALRFGKSQQFDIAFNVLNIAIARAAEVKVVPNNIIAKLFRTRALTAVRSRNFVISVYSLLKMIVIRMTQ